jgi:hypothetical protein
MHAHRVIRRDRAVDKAPGRFAADLLPKFRKNPVFLPKIQHAVFDRDEVGKVAGLHIQNSKSLIWACSSLAAESRCRAVTNDVLARLKEEL